ncbi:MAG: RlmE family RNA methyltransferase [Candidatus Peribacteria bacterium]|nr:MAG: RlmE family RNA methyltransferase [Candidatus Peribacteria bacterium]
MTFNPRDHYHAKAKQHGFKARAVYKLEEIDKKFHIFSKKTQTVLDLGCAPGSWMQYAREQIVKYQTHASDFAIVGLDILPVDLRLSGVHIYQDSITNLPRVGEILTSHDVTQLDVIMSDAAPNTSGIKDLDAERSIQLIIDTLPIYEKYLHPDGRAVIKVFM